MSKSCFSHSVFVLLLFCIPKTGIAQDSLPVQHSQPKVAEKKTNITRQYAGIEFNIFQPLRIFGFEYSLFVAPINGLNLRFTGIGYGNIVTSHYSQNIPYHNYASSIVEIRFLYPIRSTFNGFFIGPYIQWKKGTFKYDEVINSNSHSDSYSYKLQNVGGVIGFSIVAKARESKRCHMILDFYVGGGLQNKMKISRDPDFYQYANDKTSDIEQKISGTGRLGVCVGFVF